MMRKPQAGNRPHPPVTPPKGTEHPMELSAFFPTRTIGNDPAKIRDWAQAAEDLGYDHVEVPDHVFGATARGDWQPIYTEKDAFHETFTTLAFLAAVTRKARLASGVLILPQRQTGLVAKQAAEVDVLSGGRLRLRHRCRLEPCRISIAGCGLEHARGDAG
jgi:alkanesulfonate monooxygenase SsuD/methylene tetrahydromethanopterin reductase-like flavin-dependent oxidoreductase (luciferase family)